MINPKNTKSLKPEKRSRLSRKSPYQPQALAIKDLDWTLEQAFESRSRLHTFEADWSNPTMELYDLI